MTVMATTANTTSNDKNQGWHERAWENVRVGWEIRYEGLDWVYCAWATEQGRDVGVMAVDLRREENGKIIQRIVNPVLEWERVECRTVSHLFDPRFW